MFGSVGVTDWIDRATAVAASDLRLHCKYATCNVTPCTLTVPQFALGP